MNTQVRIARQFAHGRLWPAGWRRCSVIRRYQHASLGERVDVRTLDGTVWECCDPSCVRGAQ